MRTPFPVVLPIATAFIILLGDCSREPTPEQRQADSTLALAKVQLNRGEYRSGLKSLTFALALDLHLDRPRTLAEEYTLLGHLSILSADFDGAILYLTKAIDQYKSLTDRTSTRKLVLEMASLRRQMGEERVAYNIYTQELRLSNVFSDTEGAREIQFAMLPTCRALDNFEEEGRMEDSLLKEYVASGNQDMQARVHFESSRSLIHRLEYPRAVEALLRALTFADHAKDSVLTINILSTLAGTYFRAGNIQQAFETYTDALIRSDRTPGARDIRVEMLMRVGNIYLSKSQFSEAGRFYRAALTSAIALKNKLAEGYLFIQLGYCAMGNRQMQESLNSIRNAVDLFSAEGYAPGLAFANVAMGIALQYSGHLNDAVNDLKTAVEQMERVPPSPEDVYAECEDIALHQQSYYDVLSELLLKLGATDDVFWYAEKNTEHALYDKLSALDLKTRNESVNGLLSQFRHSRAIRIGAMRQLAKLLAQGPDDKMFRDQIQSQIKRSQDAQEDAATAIVKQQPDLEPAVRFNGASLADVQRRLPPGNVLLRHISTSRSVYSFAVTNSRVNLQLAALDRDRLRNDIAAYMSAIRQLEALADSPAIQRKPLEQQMQEWSTELYAGLIRPVEATLAGAARVLVVPDQQLPLVPLHALRRSGGRSPYCAEQFPVAYLPSLALLGNHTAPDAPVHDIVAIGHPGTTSWDVEYELRDIRAFYKDARLYFGQKASLATWQLERGDVLHLALDLRYSARAPGNASLLLSDSKMRGVTKEKSWGDLLTLPPFPTTVISHLRADSISLDPLLPSLFLMNGSSTVILNTLPASRKAKKFFGELFYTALLAGNTGQRAFREAQVEMIRNREYAAPYLWAPFTLWDE